jgi:hypothetical protein
LRTAVILLVALAGEIVLFYFLSILTSSNLLNGQIVVSFGVVEVIAVALAKLLHIGEESDEEKEFRRLRMLSLAIDLSLRFTHLEILFPKDEEPNTPYPESQYYVLNSITRIGYWVPPHIYDLYNHKIVHGVQFNDFRELREYAEQHQIKLESRFPWEDELSLVKKNAE